VGLASDVPEVPKLVVSLKSQHMAVEEEDADMEVEGGMLVDAVSDGDPGGVSARQPPAFQPVPCR
jgi:hypothetical protein